MDEDKNSRNALILAPIRKITRMKERLREKLNAIQTLKEPFADETSWLKASETVSTQQAKLVETVTRLTEAFASIVVFVVSCYGSACMSIGCAFFVVTVFTGLLDGITVTKEATFIATAIVFQFIFAVFLGATYAGYSRPAKRRAMWLRYFSWLSIFTYMSLPCWLIQIGIPPVLLNFPYIFWCILIQMGIAPLALAIGFSVCCRVMNAVAKDKQREQDVKLLAKQERQFLKQIASVTQKRSSADGLFLVCSQLFCLSAMLVFAGTLVKLTTILFLFCSPMNLLGFVPLFALVLFILVGYPYLLGLCSRFADCPTAWLLQLILTPAFLAMVVSWHHPLAGVCLWLFLTSINIFIYSRSRQLNMTNPVSLPGRSELPYS